MALYVRRWEKLKVEMENISEAIMPGSPDVVDDTAYGMICSPSNNAEETFPKEESDRLPEIHSILSGSTMPLAG